MKKKDSNLPWIIGFAIIIVGLGAWAYWNNIQPGKYDDFAKCLADSGAKMYGAWWCPHCSEQKKDFGNSWKVLEGEGGYVECSTPERAQTQICIQAGIESYPTWRFADGSEQGGRIALEVLAQKSRCAMN